MKSGAKAYILLIEDMDELRITLQNLLESEGYHVESIGSGQEALLFMQHSSTLPDVVVTDWQLPEMDGLTFRKKMLADHRLKEVPAIVLSASKIKEEKRIEGQIATCIFKAGLIEPLLDAINDCLSSKVTAKVATSP